VFEHGHDIRQVQLPEVEVIDLAAHPFPKPHENDIRVGEKCGLVEKWNQRL